MSFLASVLRLLDTGMTTPKPYGWFHLLWFVLWVAAAIAVSVLHKKHPTNQRKVVFWITVAVVILEIYKQINYSFSYENGIVGDYQWYIFPFQFCSTPMYIGLIASLTKKGKIHESAMAYLTTFALFAGAAVMFYPTTVFISTIGVNIQTMVCHGSMIFIGIYLLATGYVKIEHKTILKAVPTFAVLVTLAAIMNEIAYRTGLLATEDFNMFFISPYCDPHLPVYSIVQEHVPFPWCLILYVIGFTAAAYIMLLLAMLIKKIATPKIVTE